jgi:hypothetical protein
VCSVIAEAQEVAMVRHAVTWQLVQCVCIYGALISRAVHKEPRLITAHATCWLKPAAHCHPCTTDDSTTYDQALGKPQPTHARTVTHSAGSTSAPVHLCISL